MSNSIAEAWEEVISKQIDRENFYSIIGKAVNVDETTRTCDLEPIEANAPRAGINLQSVQSGTTGMVIIPKEGSFIAVTFFDKRTGFVSLTSDVEKILIDTDLVQYNGGTNGGLININDLVTEYNKTKALLQAWITIINGVPIPEPGSGSPSALQAAMKAAIISLGLGSFDNLEDTAVTH